MADFEGRVGRLERTLARLSGGAIVAGVMLLAFFGVTSFYQIPTEVGKVVPRAITDYVESQLPGFGGKLRGFLTEAEEASALAKQHADELEDAFRSWGCREHLGDCGVGTYGHTLRWLDRVDFSCPMDQPVMNSVRFERCGKFNTPDEGLRLVVNCCALPPRNDEKIKPR